MSKVTQLHPYHLVDPSPWPFVASIGAFATTVGAVMYMHSFQGGSILLPLGLILVMFTMGVWWRDVIREGTFQGHHTSVVQKGLRYGMILFIVSEVCFFVAFLLSFFNSNMVTPFYNKWR